MSKNTEVIIFKSLVKLMDRKNIKSLTMAEIAKEANVSRGTIYLYFEDKYTLLERCIEFYIERLFDECPIENGPQFEQVISNLSQYQKTYKILIEEQSIPIFNKKLNAMYYQKIAASKGSKLDMYEFKEAYAIFLASGFTNLIEWWVVQERPISEGQLIELFEDITRKMYLN